MPEEVPGELAQAVYDTLSYSDVFDFPLKAREIYRYLSGKAATPEDLDRVLSSDPRFVRDGEYFALPGRGEIMRLREKREQRSQELLPYAFAYGRMIGALPFVRMVALTGSLAVHNLAGDEDFDYMLVTQAGHLWTARAFVLLLGRVTRLVGHTLCPNVVVAENHLEWSQHDLYSARELCQMIPIVGMGVYQSLMKANAWVRDLLPNAYREAILAPAQQKSGQILHRLFEFPFQGRLGKRFERWEMNRKIERFSSQAGFGEETIFNANICQGNFDHHRKWTRQELEKRGVRLNKEESGRERRPETRRA